MICLLPFSCETELMFVTFTILYQILIASTFYFFIQKYNHFLIVNKLQLINYSILYGNNNLPYGNNSEINHMNRISLPFLIMRIKQYNCSLIIGYKMKTYVRLT